MSEKSKYKFVFFRVQPTFMARRDIKLRKNEHKKQKSPKIHQKYFVSTNPSVNFAYRVQ